MTQEEKARAYDKALERAKQVYEYSSDIAEIKRMEEIFPELAESEDERIRKAIIRFIKKRDRSGCDYDYDKWIAYLEKQGASINVDSILNKVGIQPAYKDGNAWCILYGDNIQDGICGFGDTKEDALVAFIKELLEKQGEHKETLCDNCKKAQPSHSCQDITALGRCYLELEKQGEQNSADKVESKFKVGDWITFYGGEPFKILKVEPEQNGILDYLLLSQDGRDSYYHKNYIDTNAKLWTIQDAKDGDVLVDVHGNIGIFEKHDDFDWTSYCSLGCNGGFQEFNVEHEIERTHPATKEQRDLLFSKMKEARYEWMKKIKL